MGQNSPRRVQAVASQKDVQALAAQMAVFNMALVSIAQDLEAISDVLVDAGILGAEGDDEMDPRLAREYQEPGDESDLLDQAYEVADSYPPDFEPDVAGGVEIEPPSEEDRQARMAAIRAAKLRLREESTPVDPEAEADDDAQVADLNSVASVPEEGIVVGEPRPEGDIS